MAEGHRIYKIPEEHRRTELAYFKLDETTARAQDLLTKFEINPRKFIGTRGYTEEGIGRDINEVRRLEGLFVGSMSKVYADILEAIALEHGELSDWFGPKSKIIKTSRFDDYINKIDMVVETENEHQDFSHLALGMDVTFDRYDLSKKFVGAPDKPETGIRGNIDQGRLGQVKYFMAERPDHQTFAGVLHHVPQVVVGVEIERVKELGLLWMNRDNKKLAAHPVQTLFLEEAALELKTFSEYAQRSPNKEANAVAPMLETALKKVRELLREKREAGIESIKDDKVFEEIKRNLAAFTVPGPAKN